MAKQVFCSHGILLQLTLIISKSKGLPKIHPARYLDLDISDLQNWGKNKPNHHISQMNMYFDY